MSDFIVERRPVLGSPRRRKRKPEQERSLQQKCVDLLQVDGLPMAQRQFIKWVSAIVLSGREIGTEHKDYVQYLWTDYCRWGA